MMTKSIEDNHRHWSRWEADDNDIKIKTADYRLTKLFGKKLEYLAKICSARVSDIVD